MLCGQGSSVNHTNAGSCVLPRWCSRWTCPECRPIRLKRVIAEIVGGEPTIFLTLTWKVRPGWTPADAARAMQDAWAKYVALYNRREGPKALQYFVVREATKQGWPHMHLAIRAKWVPHHELSEFMEVEIGSPIVRVLKLDGIHRVAAYLAKYLGKGPHQFETLKRYWKTLGWLLPAFAEEGASRRRAGEWYTDPRHWQEIAFDKALRGFRVEKLNPGAFIHAKAEPERRARCPP